MFLIAAQKLGVDPEDCIVIEDAIAGIEAANNAGMISIGIGDSNTLSKASLTFNSTSELTIDVINNLIRK